MPQRRSECARGAAQRNLGDVAPVRTETETKFSEGSRLPKHRPVNRLNTSRLHFRLDRLALVCWSIFVLAVASCSASVEVHQWKQASMILRSTAVPHGASGIGLCNRLRGGKGKGKDAPDPYAGIEAPKRPLSAYMLFAGAVRPSIVKEKPELKMTEISGVIGEKWKKLKPEEKSKYEKEAVALKAKYEKSKAEYEAKVPEDVRKERVARSKTKGRNLKPKKDPNAPKKPHSAFMIYSISVREKVRTDDPSLSFGDVGRRIAEQWNSKTPEEKKVYEEKAAVLKEKYLAEKAKYEASKGDEEEEEEEEPKAKKSKSKKAK